MVRALVSHQCGPVSNPDVEAICGLCLLIVGSPLLRVLRPVFPSPQKPTFPNSNSLDQESGRRRTTKWMCYFYDRLLIN